MLFGKRTALLSAVWLMSGTSATTGKEYCEKDSMINNEAGCKASSCCYWNPADDDGFNGRCFSAIGQDPDQEDLCEDFEWETCERCSASEWGAAAGYDCTQHVEMDTCQGAGGSANAPFCFWRGEEDFDGETVFFGPGCVREDRDCVPCEYQERVTDDMYDTDLGNEKCSKFLDERSCNANYGVDSDYDCVWKGYRGGSQCGWGDIDLTIFGNAVAAWVWLTVIVSVLCFICLVCAVAIFCCGATMCCIGASKAATR